MLAKICIFLVLLACRQGAATFYRHENPVTAAVQLGPLLVFLVSLLSLLSFLLSFLLPSFLTCENLHPSNPWQNGPTCELRKYALETYPGADCENMRSAKIILSPYGSVCRVAKREGQRFCLDILNFRAVWRF